MERFDLVIFGHEHTFDHKVVDGIDYILSGNTGNGQKWDGTMKGNIYTLFFVRGDRIAVQAIRKNQVIREVVIK